ncbi:FISUMP domain-containing protein [Flammeovirga sp. EKP202]|uniref:FISUMP domain-containing protein n=1 Tax=Flammeovirga sp. EKP202 TaxID=2770592 RepID=UPI00165F013E|nr:FISUMP domain-containing protein [Flammeovirga sp. EKP202]MBD0403944.1 fibrobacter succinogenes major paralogous domain-containing protein [Flammeovirga sp. EKP202]
MNINKDLILELEQAIHSKLIKVIMKLNNIIRIALYVVSPVLHSCEFDRVMQDIQPNIISWQLTDDKKGTVTDIDGNIYNTIDYREEAIVDSVRVEFGNIWMVESLRTTKLNDGTRIAHRDELENPFDEEAMCWADDNEEFAINNNYGAFYNRAITESNKICPEGWHLPSTDEVRELLWVLDKSGFSLLGIPFQNDTGEEYEKIEELERNFIGPFHSTLIKSIASKNRNWPEPPYFINDHATNKPYTETERQMYIGYKPDRNNRSGFNLEPSGYYEAINHDFPRRDIAIYWEKMDSDNNYNVSYIRRDKGFHGTGSFYGVQSRNIYCNVRCVKNK